jgi:hypothetical protein
MALEDIAPGVFGQFPDMSGSLSPEQVKALQNNAAKQAILASAVTMLGMSGNQRVPVSTGQALGAALGAGSGAYQGSFDNTLKQMITGQQMQDYRTKADARRKYEQAIAGATTRQPQPTLMSSGPGSQLQMLRDQTSDFGVEGDATTARALMSNPNLPMREVVDTGRANQAALDYLRQTDPAKFIELTTPKAVSIPDKIQQYEFAKTPEGGGFKGSYTDFIRSGTPSTNVSVSMDKGIAAQIGPMLKDERIQAQGAANQIDASDRIIQAVDTNKIITGPTASAQLRLAQVGSVLGITGKDTAEIIANTRQAIRGFAELTLQGRKSMRGEGSITESEGTLAERAFSGDIDSLTPAEIKQLANASKRAAEFNLGEYNRKLDVLRKDPNTAQLAPFYEINRLPSPTAPIKKYNPVTRKVE